MCLKSRVAARLFSIFDFIGDSFPAHWLDVLLIVSTELTLSNAGWFAAQSVPTAADSAVQRCQG